MEETKELVVLNESPSDTQKKLRQWLSTGYKIEILAQSAVVNSEVSYSPTNTYVITTLYRTK